MVTKHAKYPWEVQQGEVIKNKEFKEAVKIYRTVKEWCQTNCKGEFKVDDKVYADGVRVTFRRPTEAKLFEETFNG
jgi:hypothetical protein